MDSLKILSGGAAQGLVERLAPAFKTLSGADVTGEFGAVGAMAAKLRSGTPADLVILSETVIEELACQGFLTDGTWGIGRVETAVAIRSGDPIAVVNNGDDLRDALLAADEIYGPDTQTSTAGIHFATVLAKLGIAEKIADRLKVYPNGTTAMRHLVASKAKRPIGCTQSTEILNTPGAMLVGPLPQGYDLATVYTAAIPVKASASGLAQKLIGVLIDSQYRDLRKKIGFEEIVT